MNIKTAAQAIFYNRSVFIKKERAKKILFKTITQNNPSWHSVRRLRISGCICYYMFIYMINNHDLDEWKKKGNQLESTAIEAYHEKTENTTEKSGIVILHNTPPLGFSPDAIADGDTFVEVKCPKNDNKLRADELVKCQSCIKLLPGGQVKLSPKHAYYGQIQLGLCMLIYEEGTW
ncbi:hypothetical protein QAD02_002545 [Eretmocerus hayati]|uniref:Uncharacterized protein n=1 Tax=Eretmocerus hayati TaxID=131215 RepID=A0ACC2NJL9_9HYME|nr:hypothetical protein QAD02_002545 [Eretmocerus hayati]